MSTNSNLFSTNQVLSEKASAGDETAFRQLYEAISGKMYSLCLRYASTKDEANDFFHDGFVKLYKYLGNYRGEGSFEGWARKIFVSACLDAVKKKKALLLTDSDEGPEMAVPNGIYDKMSLDDLMEAIHKLPAGYRTMINLHIIEDYSHKEIAAMLDITETASKSKMHKARVYLKKILGGTDAE